MGRVPQWSGSWPPHSTGHLKGQTTESGTPSSKTRSALFTKPSSLQLDSTWIVFNHPLEEDQANTYAGFLMALGLQGHLTTLSDFHLYDYLQEKHELTVIGLLLGVTAGRCASYDKTWLLFRR